MESATDFKAADYGLVEFPVAERQGLPGSAWPTQPPSIDDWLGDFDSFHRPWDLPEWRTTRVREFEVDCNWKTFIEVFNEYYHLPMVHPDSISWLYPEPDAADETSGQYTTQFGATEGAAALLEHSQQFALAGGTGIAGARGDGYTLYLDLSEYYLCTIAGFDVDVPGVSDHRGSLPGDTDHLFSRRHGGAR